MQKKSASQSGIFNIRILIAIALCSLGASLGWLSFAATPSSGTITDVVTVQTYSAGPFNVANPTPLIQVDSGPECNGTAQPCDDYALTATIPAAYLTANPNASIKVTAGWTDTGSGNSDYDLYIYKNPRADCTPNDCTTTDGTQTANYQSATGSNPEVAVITPLVAGTQKYTIVLVPYTPTREVVNVRIELQAGGSGGGCTSCGNFGGPDPTVPGNPRYQTFVAPTGSSAESSQGEFNIGFNPLTHHIFVMNIGPIWRLTPGEVQVPAKPECCEALWEDKSNPTTNTGLDPILWTDQNSGRTFGSNSTAGANVAYGLTDSTTPGLNDGDVWIAASASPPNGGADHETIGSGPYPNIAPFNVPGGLGDPNNAVTHGHAVYYCSQDVVGPAACQRSDNLGLNYVTVGGVPYDGNTGPGCGGLHGHLHVSPDGTAWLPVNQCSGKQGGAFTTTAGQPSVAAPTGWTQFVAGNATIGFATSQVNGADPSIAIDANNTIYYAYVNNEGGGTEGHARVLVGTLNTATGVITWTKNFDLGASHGIKNAAHIEAVGGSTGRAAVGFLGTNVAGNYQAGAFPGKWYAFIATTYDGGTTWTTVNSTPNDPVQSMTGVWQQGGSGDMGDRNLLDFNEITVDDKGHVLYGYSDGCVTEGCIAGTAPNDFVADMRVARQSGGKGLFLPDPIEPALPKPPCLSGTRDASGSRLTWKAPDNGGADITGYQILRAISPGGEAVIVANTGTAKTTYDDTTANPTVVHYYYTVKAINGQGIGSQSNEIDLTVVVVPIENLCLRPGLTELTDHSGDTSAALGVINTPAPPGSDLLKFQIAQPFQSDGVPRLVFTITTDNGQSPQPTGSAWYVAMKIVNGATTTYKGVHMAWKPTSPTTPIFESYTPGPNNTGGVDGRFVTPGSEVPAQPGSSYASPFNKVVIIVKASDLGLAIGDTISGFVSAVSQSTDPGATVGAGATALYDMMPDSLAYTGTYTLVPANTCSPVLSVVSRKTHGAAGDKNIDLPFVGSAGIECRGTPGATNPYKLIYTLDRNVTVAGTATTSQPTATATTALGPASNQVTVNLTGVTNAQHLIVTLNGVQDAAGGVLNNLGARMDVLLGDINANGLVNSTDTSLVQAQSGKPVTGNLGTGNYRTDVNFNGLINSTDTSIVQSKSGTGLPPN